MRGGVIFLIVALLLAYVAVTGRYKCFSSFLACIMTGDCGCPGPGAGVAAAATAAWGVIPPLPVIGSNLNITPAQAAALEAVDTSPVGGSLNITPAQRAALEAVDTGRQ